MTNDELDRAVARDVLGWTVADEIPTEPTAPLYVDHEVTFTVNPFRWVSWSPSESFEYAYLVVQHLHDRGYVVQLTIDIGAGRFCTMRKMGRFGMVIEHVVNNEPTITRAICMTALRAVNDPHHDAI